MNKAVNVTVIIVVINFGLSQILFLLIEIAAHYFKIVLYFQLLIFVCIHKSFHGKIVLALGLIPHKISSCMILRFVVSYILLKISLLKSQKSWTQNTLHMERKIVSVFRTLQQPRFDIVHAVNWQHNHRTVWVGQGL